MCNCMPSCHSNTYPSLEWNSFHLLQEQDPQSITRPIKYVGKLKAGTTENKTKAQRCEAAAAILSRIDLDVLGSLLFFLLLLLLLSLSYQAAGL